MQAIVPHKMLRWFLENFMGIWIVTYCYVCMQPGLTAIRRVLPACFFRDLLTYGYLLHLP